MELETPLSTSTAAKGSLATVLADIDALDKHSMCPDICKWGFRPDGLGGAFLQAIKDGKAQVGVFCYLPLYSAYHLRTDPLLSSQAFTDYV